MRVSIGFLLDDTARLFRRAFDARARQSGITALQSRLIAYLDRHDGIRQSALADLIEVEPITLSRMVDRLAEAGLVERRPDPADRRAFRLHLTARGTARLGAIRAVTANVADDAMEGLTAADREALAALVDRVRANLSRRSSESGG